MDKRYSTAGDERVEANLPGRPFEMRSKVNDFKHRHSIENLSRYIYGKCKVSIYVTVYKIFATKSVRDLDLDL